MEALGPGEERAQAGAGTRGSGGWTELRKGLSLPRRRARGPRCGLPGPRKGPHDLVPGGRGPRPS